MVFQVAVPIIYTPSPLKIIIYLVLFPVLVNHLKNIWDLYGNYSG